MKPEELTAADYTPLKAYIEKMRQIDPDIRFIACGMAGGNRHSPPLRGHFLKNPYVKENLDYLAPHAYKPWKMRDVRRDSPPA